MQSDELVQLTEAQTEAAREIVQAHIDGLNQGFAEKIAEMQRDNEKFQNFGKRSTYLVWFMFFVSGFLLRGFLVGSPGEWETSTFLSGFAFGACVYLSVYGFVSGFMRKD